VVVGFFLEGAAFQLVFEVQPLIEVGGVLVDGYLIAHAANSNIINHININITVEYSAFA
jgi:hypothetical protein